MQFRSSRKPFCHPCLATANFKSGKIKSGDWGDGQPDCADRTAENDPRANFMPTAIVGARDCASLSLDSSVSPGAKSSRWQTVPVNASFTIKRLPPPDRPHSTSVKALGSNSSRSKRRNCAANISRLILPAARCRIACVMTMRTIGGTDRARREVSFFMGKYETFVHPAAASIGRLPGSAIRNLPPRAMNSLSRKGALPHLRVAVEDNVMGIPDVRTG